MRRKRPAGMSRFCSGSTAIDGRTSALQDFQNSVILTECVEHVRDRVHTCPRSISIFVLLETLPASPPAPILPWHRLCYDKPGREGGASHESIHVAKMDCCCGFDSVTLGMAACGTVTGAAVGARSGAAIGAGAGYGAGRGALIDIGVGAAARAIHNLTQ